MHNNHSAIVSLMQCVYTDCSDFAKMNVSFAVRLKGVLNMKGSVEVS